MIGFTPRQVREMSLAEAVLAIDGFMEMKRAESGKGENVEPPTREELDEMMRQYPDT